MLSPEKVKTLLVHEDPEVRNEAIRYFEYRHDRSMVSADDIWNAIDTLGLKHSERLLSSLDRFEQSDRSMQRLIEHLGADEIAGRDHSCLVLKKLPLHWLAKYREQIVSLPTAGHLVDDDFLEQLSLIGKPAHELGEMLKQHVRLDHDPWDDLYVEHGSFLARAAAASGDGIKQYALDVLRRERADSWEEVWAIQILGDLRAKEMIDLVMPRLELYGDFGEEELIEALVNIACPELVSKLEEKLPQSNRDFAFSITEILGRYPTPESQQLLLKVARGWTEDRSIPSHHLIRHLPDEPEVLEFLRAEATSQDSSFLSSSQLDEEMLILGKMTGMEFPESEQWRIAKAKRGTRQISRMLNDRLDWEENYPQEFPPPTPITAAAKVGRNDPCPCGSGKKYKKCCIGKATSE